MDTWSIGDAVEARWIDGKYWNAWITEDNGDGTYGVNFEDDDMYLHDLSGRQIRIRDQTPSSTSSTGSSYESSESSEDPGGPAEPPVPEPQPRRPSRANIFQQIQDGALQLPRERARAVQQVCVLRVLDSNRFQFEVEPSVESDIQTLSSFFLQGDRVVSPVQVKFKSQSKWGKSFFTVTLTVFICKKCGTEFSINTRPSNLVGHVVKKHGETIPAYLVEKKSSAGPGDGQSLITKFSSLSAERKTQRELVALAYAFNPTVAFETANCPFWLAAFKPSMAGLRTNTLKEAVLTLGKSCQGKIYPS